MININNAGSQCFESRSSQRIQEKKKTPNTTPQISTTVGKDNRFVVRVKGGSGAAFPGLLWLVW